MAEKVDTSQNNDFEVIINALLTVKQYFIKQDLIIIFIISK